MEYFTQALDKQPEVWNSEETICQLFESEGHKRHFVTTVASYVQSLQDILGLWRVHLVDCSLDCPVQRVNDDHYPLSAQQLTTFNNLCRPIHSRHQYYIRERTAPLQATPTAPAWTSFHTLLGKPDTRKSQVLVRTIDYLVNTQCRGLVATPVALLAKCYQAIFANNVTCETVHAAFRGPVTTTQQHTLNLALSGYDAIMIEEAMFGYIAGTLNKLQV